MCTHRFHPLIASLAFLFPGTIALAATTQPTGPDYSTPQTTFHSLIAAIRANDAAAFEDCFIADTAFSKRFIHVFALITTTTGRLQLAIRTHMPDDAKTLSASNIADQVEKPFANATAEIENDHAWLKTPTQTRDTALQFRKIGDDWKIDVIKSYKLETDAGKEGAEKLMLSGPKMIATFTPIIADINSGKIKTLAEMRAILANQKTASQAATQPASTLPSQTQQQ
jgi:hypothetical protein